MGLFAYDNPQKSDRNLRIYATFEIIYTGLNVIASMSFLVGSVLFFSDSTMTLGTVFFVLGSVFFVAKPISRFVRELLYARTGTGIQALAERASPGMTQGMNDDESRRGEG